MLLKSFTVFSNTGIETGTLDEWNSRKLHLFCASSSSEYNTHTHKNAINEMLTIRNKLAFSPTSKDIPLIDKSTNEDCFHH